MILKKYTLLFYIIFFLSIIIIFDGFTNTYIVIRENYEKRMLNLAGFCNNQGYGFYKKTIEKFSNDSPNIDVLNYNNFPTPKGYFFNYQKNYSNKNQIILIGAKEENINQFLTDNFRVVYSEDNCFFLKND